MSDKWWKIAAILGAIAAILGLSYLLYHKGFENGLKTANDAIIEVRDTIILRDTITREKPVYIARRIVDTIYIRTTVKDTAFVAVPREEKVYQDSTYRAVVSGYLPSLDTIQIYQTEREIIRTVKVTEIEKKRWGVGIQAGVGGGIHQGQVIFTPYIGVGISYNLLRF